MPTKVYKFPDDCHYTQSDEWVRVDGTTARIGITDYAQSELSDIVFVELPEVGTQVDIGDAFGVVESVKAVSDLLAPVPGEITETNTALDDSPEWLNEEPYGRGWIVTIEIEDLEALDALMNAEAYQKYVEERSGS
jgi:glycine cleavage system H protein